jgi:hypothetical protein
MRFLSFLFSFATLAFSQHVCNNKQMITPLNGCVSFVVASGTGCDWMCNYCANSLGTNNYYFTDQVCTYYPGGCQGNPQAGVQYTCCSA